MLYLADVHGSALPAALEALFADFTGTDRYLLPDAETVAPFVPATAGSYMPTFATLAQNKMLKLVSDDNQPQANTLPLAVAEFIRQMAAAGETVKRSTCGTTPTAISGMQGNGSIVLTTVRGDGVGQELCVPETARVVCATDSYTGTATAGSEAFTFYGQIANAGGTFAYDWPGGSAAVFTFSAVDANTGPSATGNLLSNSDFETFTTANVPDGWVIAVGTAGTNVLQDSATVYANTSSLKFVGDGSTQISVTQTFATAGGVAPTSLTAYAVNLWVRVHTVPAAGVLTIDLYDTAAGAVVADAAGTNNTKTVSVPGLTNDTWTNVSAVFRLPKTVPAGLQIRLRMSTALSSGSSLYLDHLAFAPVTVPYPGGPGVAVFGGSTAFAATDAWSVAVANDRGGASDNATFQALFDRLYDMRGLGLQLPSASSPTQADTLITS